MLKQVLLLFLFSLFVLNTAAAIDISEEERAFILSVYFGKPIDTSASDGTRPIGTATQASQVQSQSINKAILSNDETSFLHELFDQEAQRVDSTSKTPNRFTVDYYAFLNIDRSTPRLEVLNYLQNFDIKTYKENFIDLNRKQFKRLLRSARSIFKTEDRHLKLLRSLRVNQLISDDDYQKSLLVIKKDFLKESQSTSCLQRVHRLRRIFSE